MVLSVSSFGLNERAGSGDLPVFRMTLTLAALPFSSIHCRIHTGDAPAPVLSTATVLIHVSEPEKRLIDSSRLLVDSVNRFHLALPPFRFTNMLVIMYSKQANSIGSNIIILIKPDNF